MKLSLIGMSGSGKSYWSGQLAERGFIRFCCDDLIAQKLIPELTQPDGSLLDVGEWMGFPYETHYQERAAQYLAYEIEVLNDICAYLDRSDENIVVDTTGSAIYTGEAMMNKLRQRTIMVHLATPLEVQQVMLHSYLTNQRPVVWNGLFDQAGSETPDAALARCYPELLSSREALYVRYADVSLDYHTRRQENFGVDDFLSAVAQGYADHSL